VTVAFDNDAAGKAATVRAIDAATSAPRSPHIWVLDPDLLGDAKDPGDLVRANGLEGWARSAVAPICGITARALEVTGPLPAQGDELTRRAGLSHASAWLGTLDPRHAIEQSAALDTVADTLGYDAAAARRDGASSCPRSGSRRQPP